MADTIILAKYLKESASLYKGFFMVQGISIVKDEAELVSTEGKQNAQRYVEEPEKRLVIFAICDYGRNYVYYQYNAVPEKYEYFNIFSMKERGSLLKRYLG